MTDETKDAVSDSDLCLACGLCCDGSMFGEVFLRENEWEDVEKEGFIVVSKSDHREIHLPCVKFLDGKCSIYAKRMYVCREYRCKLLYKYQAGQLDFLTARKHVQKAVGMRDSLLERLGVDRREHLGRIINKFWERRSDKLEGSAFRKSNAQLLADIAIFKYFMNKYFYDSTSDQETTSV